MAELNSSDRHVRDLDDRSDQRIGIWPQEADDPYSSSLGDDDVANDRPSIGRRIFRTLTRFSIAALIGVGATLAWQSHGDAARGMVAARVPTLAWLLSVPTTSSPVAAASSPEAAQQLGPLAFNVDVVRRSVEQLAAKQEQMAQNIATLQAVEEDIRQKMSSAPPSPSQQAASIPPQPRAPSAVPSSPASRPTTGLSR